MSQSTNPLLGIQYLLQGLRILTHSGVKRFVIMPLLINIIVFSGAVWIGVGEFNDLMAWLLPEDAWYAFLRFILWPIFALAIILTVFFTFTVVANFLASPFNALLSEKVELAITGKSPNPPSTGILKEILPTILTEIRKLLYFLIRAIPLLILFLIPGVNIIAGILWFLFNAWFMTLVYTDYPMSNQGIGFSQQLSTLKKRRLMSFSFGSTLTFLMMIPILNFVAMPAAVAGATIFWCRQRDLIAND